MQKLTLNAWGSNHEVSLVTNTYLENENLYIGLISYDDGYPEPWSDLTVNLGEKLPPDTAYIDTNNNGGAIVDWLEENHLGECTGMLGFSGFCVYPQFKFDMDAVKKYLYEEEM